MGDILLPEGWLYTIIGRYLYIKNGFSFKSKDYVEASEDSHPVIRISDIDGEYASDSNAVHVINKVDGFDIENGDLLIAMSGATTGKIGVYKGMKIAYQNQRVGNIKLLSEKFGNHLFRNYLILFIKDKILKASYGGAQPNISGNTIEKISILLPPLFEQKIIAEKLDLLLAQVQETKSRLEQIPELLKQFRQSVLSDAVNGKLTEDWRINKTHIDVEDISLNWNTLKLTDIGELSRGKSKHRPRNDPKLFGNEYPFIQTGDVANSNGKIKKAHKYYSKLGLAQSKLFEKGTLCITIAANIADTAILDIEACFPDSIVGFLPKKDKCNALFVKFLIDCKKNYLNELAPATAQKNINLKILNEIYLSIPSLEEQNEIVRRVEQLFAYADKIEQQVNTALEKVNHLPQSILAKAFRGELTAQWRAENVDLITGENSAASLLEKIQVERAQNIKNKKKK